MAFRDTKAKMIAAKEGILTRKRIAHRHSGCSDMLFTQSFEVNDMEGQIFSLVYVSSARRLLEDAELEAILLVSRRNNLRDEITGMLLYKGGNIMQVLEGPEDKVLALVEKLRQDPRHHGLLILLRSHIAERQFDQWAMAFHKAESPAKEDLEGISDFLDNEIAAQAFRSNPASAYRLLLSFRDNIR